jgi:hypothetical protein
MTAKIVYLVVHMGKIMRVMMQDLFDIVDCMLHAVVVMRTTGVMRICMVVRTATAKMAAGTVFVVVMTI